MRMSWKGAACAAGVLGLTASAALAGGAWVPEKGDGDFQFGYSRKYADHSWNPQGQSVENGSHHLFRYGYIGGEFGLGHRVSLRYTVLYLDGAEGPPGDYEQNKGPSETFFGFKYRLHDGTWKMAMAANVRTSILYDQDGTYDRHDFLEDDPNIDGVDSEWRGLLGEDYGLSFLLSRGLAQTGWMNFEAGYSYRTGNLADEYTFYAEVGYPFPWDKLFMKGTYSLVDSAGNNSEKRQHDDRFGCSPNNCFPDASRQVIGSSFFLNIGKQNLWWVEAGYNHWLWGRSTRKYDEPFFSLGRRF